MDVASRIPKYIYIQKIVYLHNGVMMAPFSMHVQLINELLINSSLTYVFTLYCYYGNVNSVGGRKISILC